MLVARLTDYSTTLLFLLLGRDSANTGSLPCSTLSNLLPRKVSYPASSSYTSSILSYFFLQEHLAPACILTPSSTSDVAIAIAALSSIHSIYPAAIDLSIRSGGHSPVKGAANNNGGITIDLRALDSIDVSQDQTVVSVGAGTLWNATYAKLDPLNISVSGGRVAGIGAGGFLTGGGISFFSPQRGWACDGVIGMEVVLASGKVVNASAQSHPDLFQALKGGSNNFGVVTRFELATFALGDFLGGARIFPSSTVPQQLQAFNTFMQPENFDEKATAISGYIYDGPIGQQLVSIEVEYSLPVLDPVALQPFLNISGALIDSMRISNLSDFTSELATDQALNSRGIYVNTVFSPTLAVLEEIYALWNSSIPLITGIDNVQYGLLLQRLPATILGNNNSLGLGPSAVFDTLCLLSVTWTNATDDELIYNTTQTLINQISNVTKAACLFNDFEYLNYAAFFQDPLDGYGTANFDNLITASKQYDPLGFFQSGVPGGFKLK
ncbi:Bifunctional solanapyrone synthase [Lachnellula arida]|uniref:Bifunctional solanapyrone synthase n=1 Tax=Lachnellula arida TaxID=1316785 RepID=A0A8T9BQ28_9HELO|nr:Bifunctional solanapyrone synthase [Lachnellula arida]